MIRRPPRSTRVRSSAASDVYKRQELSEELKAYKGVWVFIEHDRGHVHSVSWELLGEARKLADTLLPSVSAGLRASPSSSHETLCTWPRSCSMNTHTPL